MKKNKLLILLLSTMLSSCAHIKTPEENIKDLNNGTVALVISGCDFKYKTNNIILSDTEEDSYCTTYWKSDNGNSISLRGYSNINFILPGTYELSGFNGYIDSRTSIVYNKKDEAPSLFTSFTVEGGEVIYIGDFEMNTVETKLVLQSIKPVYYKMTTNTEYLGKYYPSLTGRLENRYVEMKPEFEFIRDYMPIIEE